MKKHIAIMAVLVLQTGIAATAGAGGMTVGDLGPHAEGRAGAFGAKADDLTAIEYNPAGLTTIGGTSFYLSNRFGYAFERYHRAPTLDDGAMYSFAPVENGTPWQLLNPVIAAGSNFGLENWAFAIGAYAPPGISRQKFPEDGGQRYMLLERDVKILYYSLSAAWKYKDVFGLGASVQWVDAASIKLSLIVDGNAFGVVNPVSSSTDIKSTIEGADHFGVSGIVGVWYRPLPFLQLSLSGRVAPTPIDASCTLTVKTYDPSFTADPTLTRNGRPANDVSLSMTLPPTGRLAARYIHLKGDRPLFDIELDFVFEAWSLTDKYTVNARGMNANIDGTTINMTINKIDIPKQWKNTYSVRLGGDYNVIDKWLTLRLGGMYESAATQPEYAYVDFFSYHRVGGAVGASVMFFGVDISLSYNFIYEIPYSVTENEGKIYQQVPGTACTPPYNDPLNCDPDYPGQPSATANAGDYQSRYHFTTLSVSYTF